MFLLNLQIRIKCLLSDRYCMFWTFLFPVVLSFLFCATIPDTSYQYYKSIPVAIVGNLQEDNLLYQSMRSVKSSSGKNLFQVSFCSKVSAEDKLSYGDIAAFIERKDDYEVHTNSYKAESVIVKTFLNWFVQTEGKSLIDFEMQYFMEECSRDDFDKNAVYFLSLICFTALLAMHWGVRIAHDMEGNLSSLGSRIMIAPVSKIYINVQNIIAMWLIEFVNNGAVLGVCILLRDKKIASLLRYIVFVQFLTCTIGILIGVLIGVLGKNDFHLKKRICEAILFICGFLSGVMFYKIRYVVESKAKVFSILNPASVSSDAIYQIYYMKNMELYLRDVRILILMVIVLTLLVLLVTRRKRHARI